METNETDFTNSRGGKLTFLKGKEDERSNEIRAKCKGVTSEKKKLSAKIRGLKMTTNIEKIREKATELLSNPEVHLEAIFKLERWLLDNKALKPRDKINLLRALVFCHSSVFPAEQKLSIKSEFAEHQKSWMENRAKVLEEDRKQRIALGIKTDESGNELKSEIEKEEEN